MHIVRNPSGDTSRPHYSSFRTLNLSTTEASIFFRDSIPATSLLDNTAIVYWNDGLRLLKRSDYQNDPAMEGVFILGKCEALGGIASDSRLHSKSNTGAIWSLDFRNLKRSKILGIPKSTIIDIDVPDYNDKVVTYV